MKKVNRYFSKKLVKNYEKQDLVKYSKMVLFEKYYTFK